MNNSDLVNLFFIITGSAVLILTVLLAVGIIYLINIFRTIKRIVRTAEFAGEVIKEDVMELRSNIKENGFNISSFAGFMTKMAKHRFFSKSKK